MLIAHNINLMITCSGVQLHYLTSFTFMQVRELSEYVKNFRQCHCVSQKSMTLHVYKNSVIIIIKITITAYCIIVVVYACYCECKSNCMSKIDLHVLVLINK